MGRNHARYDSCRFADFGSDRRFPALGVQLRLGLWTVWNRRCHFDRRADSGADWSRVDRSYWSKVFLTSATSCFSVKGLASFG